MVCYQPHGQSGLCLPRLSAKVAENPLSATLGLAICGLAVGSILAFYQLKSIYDFIGCNQPTHSFADLLSASSLAMNSLPVRICPTTCDPVVESVLSFVDLDGRYLLLADLVSAA